MECSCPVAIPKETQKLNSNNCNKNINHHNQQQHQQPTINHQQPTTNQQQPRTNQPTTNNGHHLCVFSGDPPSCTGPSRLARSESTGHRRPGRRGAESLGGGLQAPWRQGAGHGKWCHWALDQGIGSACWGYFDVTWLVLVDVDVDVGCLLFRR